jgi:hypothetical protein
MINHIPEYYKNKLIDININGNLILDELDTTTSRSSISEASNKLFISQQQTKINENNSTLFLLINNVEEDINNLTEYNKSYNHAIGELEKKNKLLKQEYDNLDTGNNSSKGLIAEYQFLYNRELFFLLFLTICIICLIALAVYYLSSTTGGGDFLKKSKKGVSSIIKYD